MRNRVSAPTAIAALLVVLAPAARGQAAPATVRVQPVNTAAMQQTLTTAQTMSVKPMPPAAAAAQARIMPVLSAPAKAWVQSEARVIAGRDLSASAMASMARNDAKARFAGQGMTGMDIDALVQVVMMEVSQDAQNDLRSQLADMQQQTKQKQAQRAAATAEKAQQAAMKDSLKKHEDQLGDMSQEQQMKMQMAMDRMSKADQALSNIMKQQSATASAILSNLK